MKAADATPVQQAACIAAVIVILATPFILWSVIDWPSLWLFALVGLLIEAGVASACARILADVFGIHPDRHGDYDPDADR